MENENETQEMYVFTQGKDNKPQFFTATDSIEAIQKCLPIMANTEDQCSISTYNAETAEIQFIADSKALKTAIKAINKCTNTVNKELENYAN